MEGAGLINMEPIQADQDEVMRRLSRKLDSKYIRTWCQEWEMGPDAIERAIEYYARIEDPIAVLAFLAGMASGQRCRYRRADILLTPEAFIEKPSRLCLDTESALKAMESSLSNRSF